MLLLMAILLLLMMAMIPDGGNLVNLIDVKDFFLHDDDLLMAVVHSMDDLKHFIETIEPFIRCIQKKSACFNNIENFPFQSSAFKVYSDSLQFRVQGWALQKTDITHVNC